MRKLWQIPAWRIALIIVITGRLFLLLWGAVAQAILPPEFRVADEEIRPYLGEPILDEGSAAVLLGPWQRFDTNHYARIARQGYANADDSVFPPLYPLLMRWGGGLLGLVSQTEAGLRHLVAGLIISTAAYLLALRRLYTLVAAEWGNSIANRTLVYLTLFPTAFFFFGGYTEALFFWFVLESFWAGRNGRFPAAGIWGALAALTRLTGWTLSVPLLWFYLEKRGIVAWPKSGWPTVDTSRWRQLDWQLLMLGLPLLGTAAFVGWRQMAGLPPLPELYEQVWHQTTSFPGKDIITGIQMLLAGELTRSPITLAVDYLCTLLLIVSTWYSFRKLGPAYGLYNLMMLLFILLPTSELKPLYSFSRYTLIFFPTFILLAQAGERPLYNRLILYPCFLFYLFFSGQFFMWGWVA